MAEMSLKLKTVEQWLEAWTGSGQLKAAAQQALAIPESSRDFDALLTAWAAGDFKDIPPVEAASSTELAGAHGGFDSTNNRILINQDWTAQASEPQLQQLFAEELGHWLDHRFNSKDTPGDEGALFAAELLGLALSDQEQRRIASEDDQRQLNIDGHSTVVEQNRVYETRWLSTSVNEDGTITLEVYLTTAPAVDVTVTVGIGSEWASANGSSGQTEIVFNPSNFETGQQVVLRPADDLVAEGDRIQSVNLSFSSDDTTFNGLEETLSTTIIDNDFQRTLEPLKAPSGGNNAINYDTSSGSNLTQNNVVRSYTRTDHWVNTYLPGNNNIGDRNRQYTFNINAQTSSYDLGAGTDQLQISTSVQADTGWILFKGGSGNANDTISGAALTDSGAGNDNITIASTAGGTSSRCLRPRQPMVGPTTTLSNTNANNTETNITTHGRYATAAGAGDDTVIGYNLDDDIAGGSGHDHSGGDGNDVIFGDAYESFEHTQAKIDLSPH